MLFVRVVGWLIIAILAWMIFYFRRQHSIREIALHGAEAKADQLRPGTVFIALGLFSAVMFWWIWRQMAGHVPEPVSVAGIDTVKAVQTSERPKAASPKLYPVGNEFTVIAPVGGWSGDVVIRGRRVNCFPSADIFIKLNHDAEYEAGPNTKVDLGRPRDVEVLQFKAKTDKEIAVECTFH